MLGLEIVVVELRSEELFLIITDMHSIWIVLIFVCLGKTLGRKVN